MTQPSSVPLSILGVDRAGIPAVGPRPPASRWQAAPDFLEYWRRIMARKWLVALVTGLAGFLGLVYVQSIPPTFEATATVVIEDGRPDIVQIREVYTGTRGSRDHFTTQSEFIGSRNVAERVIKQLGLLEHPEFDPRQQKPSLVSRAIGGVRSLLLGGRNAGPASEQDLMNAVVDTFAKRLDVEPVRSTQLVKVHFSSRNPVLAAQIANAIVDAYINADMDARYAVAKQAHAWLSEHVEQLRRNLTASELALQSYREKKGLIDKASVAQAGAARQLEAIMQRLVEARVRRSQAEEQYQQIRGRSVEANESAPTVLANPSVARAREVLADARRRMADASVRFGVSHPQYQLAESELAAAQAAYRSAVETVVRAIAKEFEAARAVEKSLEKELADSRGAVLGQNRDELELAAYEQEVQTNRQLYETFMARLKETNIVSDIQNPVARAIDPAVPPSIPDKPAKLPLLLAFLAGGLIFGVAAALLRHRLDDTIATVEQAESLLSVPVISVLPRVRRREASDVHRMFVEHPDSGFSEAIRTARTALRLATMGSTDGSVIMVTSSLPQEGKSTVALNLALAQSQVAKTVLIECDIRRPTFAARLGLASGTVGLAECLRGTVEPKDCIYRVTDTKLHCIFAGSQLDSPLELLSSPAFPDLIAQLRTQFDTIILDTPPVALVSDAVALAERADGIILVVRAHATSHKLAAQTIQSLSRAGTPILGAIISQLNVKRARKYYGEYGVYDAAGYGGYERGTRPE